MKKNSEAWVKLCIQEFESEVFFSADVICWSKKGWEEESFPIEGSM